MSVYPGEVLGSATRHAGAAGDAPRRADEQRSAVRAVGAPASGAFTGRWPVAASPQRAYSGVQARSTSDDYYNTIHVRPSQIDVGNITATVVYEVEVWSAYLEASKTLDDLVVTQGAGIEVFGPALPHVFAPLEATLITVEVSANGPATIDARYDLGFTSDEGSRFWTVTGQRIIEWTIPPNWSSPYEETLEFKTEVLTAFDGSEQRQALRHLPRRTLAFTPLFDGPHGREGKRLLATWQNRAFAMADWARGVRSSGVPAGGLTLTLDEPLPELRVGRLLVLRTAGFSQVIEVGAIEGLAVTLGSPVAQAFPKGTKVFPSVTVHAGASVPGRRITSDVGTVSMAFTQLFEGGELPIVAPDVMWREREVLLRRPNWANEVSHDHNFDFAWLDSGRGAFDFRTPTDVPKDIRQFRFLLRDRADVRWAEQFFARCRGRRADFFAPTWDEDLAVPPDAILLNGSFQLPVDSANEASRVAEEKVYRNLFIRLTDGTTFLRRVVAGEVSVNGPVLILDAGWPRDILPSEVRGVHWMPRWRLASDALTFTWRTDRVAEATFAMQTLGDA